MTASSPARVGVAFTPFESRADVLVDTAVAAERLGFTAVSVPEATTLSAPVVLTQLALATERVELCSAVLSVWSRTPATLAMTAAELARVSGGRFVLGLGASTSPLVQGLHGVAWQDPVDTVRRTLSAVRALLAGERLPQVPQGVRPLRIGLPPEQPVPLALASITPPGIRVAGALADRWLPFLLPGAALDSGRDLLDESSRKAGRDAPTVTACVPVALGPDTASAARAAALWLVTYCARMGPVYPRVLREWGYAVEIEALLAANDGTGPPVLPSAAERLARDVLLFTTYEDAVPALRGWQERADELALCLPFGAAAHDLVEVLDALAPATPTAGGRRSLAPGSPSV